MATLPLETIDGFIDAVLVLARRVEHVLESQPVQEAVKEPLSSSKMRIMRLLSQRGSQTSTQIARYLDVTKPAVSQIIDSMTNRKLVARKPAKHDRREIGLTLTEQGKRLVTAVQRQQRQAIRTALRGTGAGSVRQWIKTTEQVAATMAAADKAYCLFLEHEAKLLARRERAKARA